jgi:hypothetical protein
MIIIIIILLSSNNQRTGLLLMWDGTATAEKWEQNETTEKNREIDKNISFFFFFFSFDVIISVRRCLILRAAGDLAQDQPSIQGDMGKRLEGVRAARRARVVAKRSALVASSIVGVKYTLEWVQTGIFCCCCVPYLRSCC